MDEFLQQRAQCVASHAGLYCILPEWMAATVSAVNAGLALGPEARAWRELGIAADHGDGDGGESRAPRYEVANGVALISMSGPMMKGRSKFPHANTIQVRRAIRAAVKSPAVDGIMLLVDSPGGTVAGTDELARDIELAGQAKPFRVHADDLMASAAVWATATAERITASQTTEVGSIGTILVVQDTSEFLAQKGVKVHVVSTGAMKGAGAEGAPVTDEQLRMLGDRVANVNAHFVNAMQSGRRLTNRQLEAVSDGRVFIASRALELGLIDAVMSADDAVASFRRSLTARRRSRANRQAIAAAARAMESRSRIEGA